MICSHCQQPMIEIKDGTQVCVACSHVEFGDPLPVAPSWFRQLCIAVGDPKHNALRQGMGVLAIMLALSGLISAGSGWWDSHARIPGALYADVECPQLGATDHCAALYLTADRSFDIRVEPGQCAVVVNGRCAIRAATGHVRVESLPDIHYVEPSARPQRTIAARYAVNSWRMDLDTRLCEDGACECYPAIFSWDGGYHEVRFGLANSCLP